jgi:hypothetical protein
MVIKPAEEMGLWLATISIYRNLAITVRFLRFLRYNLRVFELDLSQANEGMRSVRLAAIKIA